MEVALALDDDHGLLVVMGMGAGNMAGLDHAHADGAVLAALVDLALHSGFGIEPIAFAPIKMFRHFYDLLFNILFDTSICGRGLSQFSRSSSPINQAGLRCIMVYICASSAPVSFWIDSAKIARPSQGGI